MASFLWELAKRTYREFLEDDCMPMAAGIAYYALFSMFPLLLGIIALLGVVLEPEAVQEETLDRVAQWFPGSRELVVNNLQAIVSARGPMGALSVLGLLWSGSAIFAAVRRSLNRAWDVEKERPLLRQKLVEFAMMLGVGPVLLSSIMVTTFFRVVLVLDAETTVGVSSSLAALGTLMPVFFNFFMFAFIYRFVPNATIAWADVWPGALIAATLFEGGKHLFMWYVTNIADYTVVYGPLASTIVFLLWAYLSALVLLLGAEFSAEYARLIKGGATWQN